ncbi:hypothetical protein QE152_g39098 [Popillia japonica]|uniref:Uncharacterized protein n=1 Tax=Popillia japonica TaxID=7064 RepID=A0AAW1HUZ9_POPJA
MNNEKELTVEFIKVRLLDAELKLKNKDIKLDKTEIDFSAQRTQKCFKCGKPMTWHISVNKFGETVREGEVLIEEEVIVEVDLETIASIVKAKQIGGKRYIILHAGNEDGFIPGAELIFTSNTTVARFSRTF